MGPQRTPRRGSRGQGGPLHFIPVRLASWSGPGPLVLVPLWVVAPVLLGATHSGELRAGAWSRPVELALWLPTIALAVTVAGQALLARRRGRTAAVAATRRPPLVVRGRTRVLAALLGPATGCLLLFEVGQQQPADLIVGESAAWVFCGGGLWLLGWAYLIIWRERLEVTAGGLVVVQRFSSIEIPWHRITGITWHTLNEGNADQHHRLAIQTDRGQVVSRVPTTRTRGSGPVAELRSGLLGLTESSHRGRAPIRVSGLGRWTAGLS